MFKPLLLATALLAIGSTAAIAAPACRDAKGKFIKCPAPPAKPMRCKAANGKFAKCGTPGAKPI